FRSPSSTPVLVSIFETVPWPLLAIQITDRASPPPPISSQCGPVVEPAVSVSVAESVALTPVVVVVVGSPVVDGLLSLLEVVGGLAVVVTTALSLTPPLPLPALPELPEPVLLPKVITPSLTPLLVAPAESEPPTSPPHASGSAAASTPRRDQFNRALLKYIRRAPD